MEPLPDRVEHDGLLLRRWTVDDAEVMGALVADNLDHLRPYMPWIASEPLTLDERRTMLAEWDAGWAAGNGVMMSISDHGVAVGSCGLHRRIGPGALEIGYWVAADHLGRGIARRASTALTGLAFTVDDIDAVEIHHDLSNVHSRRVPEQLGFHLTRRSGAPREPQAPADTGVELIWRMTRDEWLARGT